MVRRKLLSWLLAIGLLVAVAGCSLFPEPPRDLVESANAYAAAVRDLPGVASAEAKVTAVDPKDKPGEWSVTLVVATAESDGLATVPRLVAGIRPPSSATTRFVVNIPGAVPVTLRALDSASVERAEVLRALPFAKSVSVGDYTDSVELIEGTPLPAVVEEVRRSGTLTADPFDAVSVWSDEMKARVAVSLAGPSDALIDVMVQLEDDPAVESIGSYEPDEQTLRPRVVAQTSDPRRLAELLSALVGDERDGRPRTAYNVHSNTEDIDGYVGLPLGSPKPDDLPTPAPPSAAPVDEATLAADTQDVTDFLLAAAALSGVPGTPDVFVGGCTNGGGSQVTGRVLLNVFTISDTADPAYDAIVESWESAGYTHSDQAMGTSFYTPLTAQPVVQVSIRGTSEGIRITALGACRG